MRYAAGNACVALGRHTLRKPRKDGGRLKNSLAAAKMVFQAASAVSNRPYLPFSGKRADRMRATASSPAASSASKADSVSASASSTPQTPPAASSSGTTISD